MKLALIRRQFSATGGAELYLQGLLTALAGRSHELHLFAESWSEIPAAAKLHAVNISGRRATRPLRFAEAVQSQLANERFDCIFSLERTLKQDIYRAGDGVHRVWLQRRREFAPWWKKPFVGWGAFHKNLLALEAQTIDPKNTRHIIVNSEMVKREILEHFAFPAERIHLVRNGVDTARFQSGRRAETRARYGVKDDEFLWLFAGSGWERKGLDFVLHAFCRLRDNNDKAKLLVAGKGRPPGICPAGVIYAGPVTDMENIFAAADLLVFPPIYEPSANVVNEALASGRPVVTSAQNGASELIREGINGSVIPNPADTRALIQAVEFWMKKKAPAFASAATLSLDRNVAETLAVLELAAAENRV
ncbi:MAG: glycosyltransferase family 4 protein [Verrucomicrobiota bacterium]